MPSAWIFTVLALVRYWSLKVWLAAVRTSVMTLNEPLWTFVAVGTFTGVVSPARSSSASAANAHGDDTSAVIELCVQRRAIRQRATHDIVWNGLAALAELELECAGVDRVDVDADAIALARLRSWCGLFRPQRRRCAVPATAQ